MTTHVSTWCMFGFKSDLIKLCGHRHFFVAPMRCFYKITMNHHGFSNHAEPNMHYYFKTDFLKSKCELFDIDPTVTNKIKCVNWIRAVEQS